MSESGAVSGAGAERARRPDIRRCQLAAALDGLEACLLGGRVRLLDALAGHTTLTAAEHRFYFMGWQATRVLAASRPSDAAGRCDPDRRR